MIRSTEGRLLSEMSIIIEFKNNLISAYEYYFSDEKAEVSLGEKIYEVIIDEDGNQIEIVDLDGE